MCKGDCGECICGKDNIDNIINKPDFIVNSIDDKGNANISWISGHDVNDDTEVVAISTAMAKAIGMPEDESNNYEVPVTTLVQTLDGKMTPIQEISGATHVMSPYMNPAAMGLGVHEITQMYPDQSAVLAFEAQHGKIDSITESFQDIGRGNITPVFTCDVGQDTLEALHSGDLKLTAYSLSSAVPDVTLGGSDTLLYNGEGTSIVNNVSPFVQARELMAQTILDDPSLHITYQSMIAMHLSDRYGMTDHVTRNECATELLEIIFRGK